MDTTPPHHEKNKHCKLENKKWVPKAGDHQTIFVQVLIFTQAKAPAESHSRRIGLK